MTSDVRARNLLWYGRGVLGEMRAAFAAGVWNGVVRRGQEALEMSLKAVLLHLGADYPRVHDVMPALLALLRQRGVRFDPERLARIERASADLADKRAPALYLEIVCTEELARSAVQAAEDAFAFACELVGAPPEGPFRPGA
jgi:HEPN domain-containing protein